MEGFYMGSTRMRATLTISATMMGAWMATFVPVVLHAQTIKSVKEETSLGATTLTVAGTDLDKVKSIAVGAVAMNITHRSDTSITAQVFLGTPGETSPGPNAGTTVPVLIKGTDGKTQHFLDSFSYPIANAQVTGPLPIPEPAGTCDTRNTTATEFGVFVFHR